MPNLRVTPYNKAKDAQLLTTSLALATGSLASNLLNMKRYDTLLTVDTSVIDIKLSWATTQSCTMIGLGRHNLSSSATIQIITYSDDAWTTVANTNSALTAFNPTGMSTYEVTTHEDYKILRNTDQYFTALTGFKSMIIRITDTGNTAGYLEAAYLFIGSYKELTYNPMYNDGGFSMQPVSLSEVERTAAASVSVYRKGSYYALPIVLGWVKNTDQADVLALKRSNGNHTPFWVSAFPGVNDYLDVYTRGPFIFREQDSVQPWLVSVSRTVLTLEGL